MLPNPFSLRNKNKNTNQTSFSMDNELYKISKDQDIAPSIQFLFGQLEETRERLFRQLSKVPEDIIDKTPDNETIESIATLLDHIAAIEWSWIFEDIDGKKMDEEEWKFAFAMRDRSKVKQRTGMTLNFYIDRLKTVRSAVKQRIKEFNEDDRLKIVGQEDDKYTIEWILYHLNHHESLHQGQISFLNRLYQKNESS